MRRGEQVVEHGLAARGMIAPPPRRDEREQVFKAPSAVVVAPPTAPLPAPRACPCLGCRLAWAGSRDYDGPRWDSTGHNRQELGS